MAHGASFVFDGIAVLGRKKIVKNKKNYLVKKRLTFVMYSKLTIPALDLDRSQ